MPNVVRTLSPAEARNKIEILDNGTARIYLTQGKVTLIDAGDVEKVAGYTWFAKRNQKTGGLVRWYAITNAPKETTKSGRTKLQLHRLLLPAEKEIDHVNHDGLDNRRDNLRMCSNRENTQNMRKRKSTSSRYKGVVWDKQKKKWKAYANVGPINPKDNRRTKKHLGYFEDEIEAARAYDSAVRWFFGPYACTNVSLGLLPEDPNA